MAHTWFSSLGKTTKLCVLFGSGVAVGAAAYAAMWYIQRNEAKTIDEGFEDTSKVEETPEKRILVLGLKGSGKSAVISSVAVSCGNKQDIQPTEGFNVVCLQHGGVALNIWEIGGGEKVRLYWSNFLQDTDLLVFVVDSTDAHLLPVAFDELHKLIADDRLHKVPVLILANKQDLPDAQTPESIADALAVADISPKNHRIRVLGTQAPPGSAKRHPSVAEVERLIGLMSNGD